MHPHGRAAEIVGRWEFKQDRVLLKSRSALLGFAEASVLNENGFSIPAAFHLHIDSIVPAKYYFLKHGRMAEESF